MYLLTWAEMTAVLLLSKLYLISDNIRRLWKGFISIGNHCFSSCPNYGVNTNFQQAMGFFISQRENSCYPLQRIYPNKHLLLKDNSILILLICIYCVYTCLCHKIHAELWGQLMGVGSHFHVGSVGKAWLASAEPNHWLLKVFYSLQWQLLH